MVITFCANLHQNIGLQQRALRNLYFRSSPHTSRAFEEHFKNASTGEYHQRIFTIIFGHITKLYIRKLKTLIKKLAQ